MNDQQTINVFKGLIIDAVDAAASGHPGGPMSSMDFTYLLFTEYLRFDPTDPDWMGRDRFVLSAGHSSMLLYTMLLGQGFINLDDIKKFRQLGSRTPGHPENFMTPGVECTTGPLGQGASMSVGMALAATHLGAKLDPSLFNQRIWAVLGDGCIQEDVTLGAASLAGHLGLNNLVWFFDSNRIQISGDVARAQSDDVQKIFEGFHWDVIEIDGHDHNALRKTLDKAVDLKSRKKPLLIIGNTTIGKGVYSMEGSAKTHGAPLPKDERVQTRKKLGLPDTAFYLSQDALTQFRRNFGVREKEAKEWQKTLENKLEKDPKFRTAFGQYFSNGKDLNLPQLQWDPSKQLATRNAFGELLTHWAPHVPGLVGGSADLEPSNMTEDFAALVKDFSKENRSGRNIVFGVREFPMAAICNGIALFGGLTPFGGTFLTFSDYARNGIRMSAIQKVRVLYEFTHDSFYLGEDGPTHQPVEHVMSLRLIPDLYVMRPADAYETQACFEMALQIQAPTAMCLSRQKLPILPVDKTAVAKAKKGAYAVIECENPDYVILATGSEVSLALKVAQKLGPKVQVVSMPCIELFDEQPESYKSKVIPPRCKKRISIEAGVTWGWQKYTKGGGLNIGLDHFGHSAAYQDLEKEYGFTVESVLERIRSHNFEE